jgi:transcriptional regulator with XRE-family HTH domain
MEYKQQLIIMDNIDRLLEKQSIKRSTIEDALSISRGYLSRLKRPEGKANTLSYELLKKISDYLNVSMDYLTLNTFDHTTDENSLIDFFESLYSMSVKDNLFWHVIELNELDRIETDPDYWARLGPIAKKIENAKLDELELFPDYIAKSVKDYIYRDSTLWSILWIGWQSLGRGRKIGDVVYTKANITGDVFHTYLEKINSTLYLYRVEYTDSGDDNKFSNINEAYLVTGDGNHFLCSSINWGEYISSKLRDLYQIARDKCSDTRLDENARKLLKQFNAN